MTRICFVCLGNICRSPMAEAIFRDLADRSGAGARFRVASRATSDEERGNPVYPLARAELERRGVAVGAHAAKRLTRADYDAFDLFVGMDGSNLAAMRRLFDGDPLRKTSKLLSYCGTDRDVSDPWYTRDFATAYADIRAGCEALLAHLCAGDPD